MATLTTITTGAAASATAISNATDIAGSISITPTGVISTGTDAATINFGYAYTNVGAGLSACQVILTPTNAVAARDMDKIYVSSTTTGTTVLSVRVGCTTAAHTYNYHIIETQTNNALGSFGSLSYGGTPAWAGATVFQGTDVAGRITISTLATAGSVTCTFGYAYATAPIMVITAAHRDTAQDIGKTWVTSTVNDFTINFGAGITAAHSAALMYHAIETQ